MKKVLLFFAMIVFFPTAFFSEEIGADFPYESELTESTEEQSADAKKEKSPPVFTYSLGAEYMYSPDMPLYRGQPLYQEWQALLDEVGLGYWRDSLGQNGHILRVVNDFEWRWGGFSLTLGANLTGNFFPAYIQTVGKGVPLFWNAATFCFEAIGQMWSWATSSSGALINLFTMYTIPSLATILCGVAGLTVVCLIPAVPALILPLMTDVSFSADWHPYMNRWLDTKLSFGIDADNYKIATTLAGISLFAQAKATAHYKQVALYVAAGYNVDIFNTVMAIKTRGMEGNYTTGFVPAPYAKAGLTWYLSRY